MKNQLMKITFLLGLLLSLSSFNCAPKVKSASAFHDWEFLGSRTVNFGLDKDEIMVTGAEGVFKSIQIRVKRSGINMHRLVVHFGDGSEQVVELKNEFRAGSASRVIDLEGNNRIIRKVTMWYDTKNYRKNRAIIELWGKH